MPAGVSETVDRKLWVEELKRELKSYHEEIRRQESVLKMLVYRGDYSFALHCAEDLQIFLGQHFLKEESGLDYVLGHGETTLTSGVDARDYRKGSLEILDEKTQRNEQLLSGDLENLDLAH